MNNEEYPSYILIAGDFGLVWSTDQNEKQEQYWIDWLNTKPWETIALLGNHENFERIYALPLEEHLGAPMYRVSGKIWIMQHGNVYDIEGNSFFAFGGGLSIDKEYRKNRVDWWEEEIPTLDDVRRGIASLDSHNGIVDYVITHTAPTEVLDSLREQGRLLIDDPDMEKSAKFYDPTIPMLMKLRDHINRDQLKEWFLGHFHMNTIITGKATGQKYRVLYNDFFKIG